MTATPKLGLLVRLEAKPEHADELHDLLVGALPLAQQETGTLTWYVLRLGPTTFGIFDTFADEPARQAHLDGKIAAALLAEAPRLLAVEPEILRVDVLAAK
ncbi:putative quinol monooxygenase [Kitasatospora sp. LaBMicrA B282]|uniref:putative quinol monooxygenase n=1 Tax=Kitasatospora sp. LaBMicrA B282 TaxID=3420949 RepID=UPI003D145398